MSLTIETVHALVFDVDNCLITCPSNDDVVLQVLRDYGATGSDDELLQTITNANSDWAIIERCVAPEFRSSAYTEVLLANVRMVAHSRCDPRLPEVLRDLARRYSLFIFSGRDRGSIDVAMRRHGIDMLFTEVVGADVEGAEKPDPRDLLALLARHRLEPNAAVYIGDKFVDKRLAEAAKTHFIGAAWYEDLLPDAPVKATSVSEFAMFFR